MFERWLFAAVDDRTAALADLLAKDGLAQLAPSEICRRFVCHRHQHPRCRRLEHLADPEIGHYGSDLDMCCIITIYCDIDTDPIVLLRHLVLALGERDPDGQCATSAITSAPARHRRARDARGRCVADAGVTPKVPRVHTLPSRDSRGRFVAYPTTHASSWYVFCCDSYRIAGELPSGHAVGGSGRTSRAPACRRPQPRRPSVSRGIWKPCCSPPSC